MNNLAGQSSKADSKEKQRQRATNQRWLDNRVFIARQVLSMSDGKTIDSRFDAQIILCCALSSLAATLWPGVNNDKKRCIETLIRFGNCQPSPKTISVPVLLRSLHGDPIAQKVREVFWKFPKYQVVSACEADVLEDCIVNSISGISLSKIREASYARLIYSELRSCLVHTYSHGKELTDWSLWNSAELEYNYVDSKPRLYIPYGYLEKVVKSTGEAIFEHWERAPSFERAEVPPSRWWISG